MTDTNSKHPTYGTYKCKNCGKRIRIDQLNYLLPDCPVCKGSDYKLILKDNANKEASH